jgi:hypothetical protein
MRKEAFEFMGRRGAKLPRKQRRDPAEPARAAARRPEPAWEKRHFTAMECQDELHMKYV